MRIVGKLERIVEDAEGLSCGCLLSPRDTLYVARRPVAVKRLLLDAPKGMAVVHECEPTCDMDDTAGVCVEASHYEVMTLSDQAKRRHKQGGLVSPAEYARRKGRRHAGQTKISDTQQVEIMSLRARNAPLSELAERYGIDASTVSRVARGQMWRTAGEPNHA